MHFFISNVVLKRPNSWLGTLIHLPLEPKGSISGSLGPARPIRADDRARLTQYPQLAKPGSGRRRFRRRLASDSACGKSPSQKRAQKSDPGDCAT